MTPKGKINLQRVLASLKYSLHGMRLDDAPSEIMRIHFERMKCPKCNAVFTLKKSAY